MQSEERDLRDRTKQFALRILEMFSVIPKSTQAQVLGKQVLRSGTSVGANYREAYRGRSKAEFVAKCGDSLRELEEIAYWLELLVDGKVVAPERLSALRQECDELIAIFVTIPEAIEGNLLVETRSLPVSLAVTLTALPSMSRLPVAPFFLHPSNSATFRDGVASAQCRRSGRLFAGRS